MAYPFDMVDNPAVKELILSQNKCTSTIFKI